MADIIPVPPRGLLEIPGLKQVGLLVGVAAAVAAAIWLVLWSQGQNYSVLYGQLSERESGQVMDALTAAVHPPAGEWLYFVLVKKDGTEAFADTYAEQLANEKLAQQRGVG